MFDNYVWSDQQVRQVSKDGKVSGFELKTLITYYRGIPLSMINDFEVIVDGKKVPREKIHFSPDGAEWFTLDEMLTVATFRWEYGEEGIVFVEWEGGLSKGVHEITFRQSTRAAYIPVPFGGERTAKVTI
ncbi:hypothetical protein AGMMS49546_19820 [Spirochaetia bacterium]|nr:hypothetical protein AGMMS49546_19820 [Spirochaetia bacterium]